MKRSWIGFVLLLVLLAGSITVTWAMVRIHDPIEADLQQAAECALRGDWENTEQFFRQAEAHWRKWEHFRACFADHTPVEEIDADFEMLKIACASQDGVTFAGGGLSLARQIAAVGEAHEFVWWNLL